MCADIGLITLYKGTAVDALKGVVDEVNVRVYR